jgi:hypothetical protein
MPDKDDDVVNVDLDPEEALRILLSTDPREPEEPSPEPREKAAHDSETVIDSL